MDQVNYTIGYNGRPGSVKKVLTGILNYCQDEMGKQNLVVRENM